MKSFLTVVVVGMIFCISTNPASATVETGDTYYSSWKLSESGKQDASSYQFLLGYVAGLYDANEHELSSCLGSEVKMSAIVDAVGQFFRDHPNKRSLAVRNVFVEALKDVWGCQ